jgi:hypothetical protein
MPDSRRVSAWTVDASTGGCRLHLPRASPIGSCLLVEMPGAGGIATPTCGPVRHLMTMGNAILVGLEWMTARQALARRERCPDDSSPDPYPVSGVGAAHWHS